MKDRDGPNWWIWAVAMGIILGMIVLGLLDHEAEAQTKLTGVTKDGRTVELKEVTLVPVEAPHVDGETENKIQFKCGNNFAGPRFLTMKKKGGRWVMATDDPVILGCP